jgi:cysteine desulfurase
MNMWDNQRMRMLGCQVDEYGLMDLKHLKTQLSILTKRKNQPILVSIIYANNEIGSINDIKVASNLVHKYGGVLHVDATQAFGHIPINVKELGIDMLSASGHKISSVLKGVGFLYKSEDVEINPLIYGTQSNGLRGGTENTFGIVGLDKAIDFCDISNEKIEETVKKRDYFIGLLQSEFGCKLNGHPTNRLPNNINVTFPQNITGESLLYTLDLSGIQIATGSACNSVLIEPSHVLKAIGLSDEDAMKTIRISLSDDITYEDIRKTIREIRKGISLTES